MTQAFYQIVHKTSSHSNELYNFETHNDVCKMPTKMEYSNIAWTVEYKEIDYIDVMVKMLLDALVLMPLKENKKTKFDYFKTVLDNVFLTDIQKEAFVNAFSRSQRHYFALNRLARHYKWSMAPISVQCDLFMNPLRESQRNVITILQHKQKYMFAINDLKTIVETAICNTNYYYAEPLPIKNPYNNMVFDKGILYSVYFFMKRGDFVLSDVFHKYFMANFNLKAFRESNEVLIRNHYLETEVKSGDIDTLYSTAIIMMAENRYSRRIQVDRRFPKKLLVDIMRPYVMLYMKKLYSLDIFQKHQCSYELNQRLKEFAEFNPRFGRKFFRSRDPGAPPEQIYSANHVVFTPSNSLTGFYTNHAEVMEPGEYDADVFDEDDDESDDDTDD